MSVAIALILSTAGICAATDYFVDAINGSDRNGGDSIVEAVEKVRVSYLRVEGGQEGEGNISEDPRFTIGYQGDYYLSCLAAGQGMDSSCIDSGLGSASERGLGRFTTRTDGVLDPGVVDMGYHYIPKQAIVEFFVDADYGSNDNPAPPQMRPLRPFLLPEAHLARRSSRSLCSQTTRLRATTSSPRPPPAQGTLSS